MTSEMHYDELLYPLLTSEENIFGFFDKIFDFLYRRTDFFKIKKDGSSKIGLELGEAEKIVRSVFCKYMEQAEIQNTLETQNELEPISLDFVAEEVVTSDETNEVEDIPSESIQIDQAKPSSTEAVPDQKPEPKIKWMDPDCYNGAIIRDSNNDYTWAQSLKDVDLRIKVPKHVTTGKQMTVQIKRDAVTTKVLSNGKWDTLKEGDLTWPINVEESTWTLIPGEHVHICLQKLQQRWWDSCFADEPKINLKAIDPSMPFEDLDEESQAKINELMYNEQQKRLGKPTIPQNKIQNILKDAWNAEGSPFKGQPYDPSLINVQNADNL